MDNCPKILTFVPAYNMMEVGDYNEKTKFNKFNKVPC